MTVLELYKHFDNSFPRELSCEWDNDGLMCCPDGEREVKRVLVSLDVTDGAVDKAIEGGFDVIISHHPMIFKGLKAINDEHFISCKAIKLIRAGISVMSFHTRLDAAEGGVNDILAGLLNLKDAVPFGDGIGRIGTLEAPVELFGFARFVKDTLGAPTVSIADANKAVFKVAVLGGSGKDELNAAVAAGADTYLSGELGHHALTDAPEMGINLIEAGHFYTEAPVCTFLADTLRGLGIESEIFNSNTTKRI